VDKETQVQCTPTYPCTAVQVLIERTQQNSEAIEKLDEELKAVRDRLPPWLTAAAWVMGVIIGVLSTLVAVGSG